MSSLSESGRFEKGRARPRPETPATAGAPNWDRIQQLLGHHAHPSRAEFAGLMDECLSGLDGLSRRKFLAVMGASLALAGLNGCSTRSAPPEEIVPYVEPPETAVPGRPLFYATTMTQAGNATGLLVESHLGRPTKIEGNPSHPASRGGTGIFQQAAVLTLYDPDRAQNVTHLGQVRTWADFLAALQPALKTLRGRQGEGLSILSETVLSPTLAEQLDALMQQLPKAKWHVWEPIHQDAALRGGEWAFGRPVHPIYDFSRADVVLSLDADFLDCGPPNLAYTADFIARRRVRTTAKNANTAAMNRLYMVETTLSCTGAKADHRLAVLPSEIEAVARAMASRLGIEASGSESSQRAKWIDAVAKDLEAHRGRCLVLAGERQPPVVHLLAHALNDRLGNVGQTVGYTAPIEARPVSRTDSLRELAADMKAGKVRLLVMLGGNPVYNAPADISFLECLRKVPLRVHHGLFVDETSFECHWHLPETHFLEAWSDARAYDGTASIVQPLIEPLYQGRSAHEVVSLLASLLETPGREVVRGHWRKQWEKGSKELPFEHFWQQALHDGLVAGTAIKPEHVPLAGDWQKHLPGNQPASATGAATLELRFEADPMLYDGSWANNGWLQELPKPVTKLAWGNAAIMSPATAKQWDIRWGSYAHGGEHGGYFMPRVELELDGRKLQVPAWIMPGHADGAITLYLGGGRTAAGNVGGQADSTVGGNAYLLRTSRDSWCAAGLQLRKLGDSELVVCTQQHHAMEDREPVRHGTLAEYRRDPHAATKPKEEEQPAHFERPQGNQSIYEPFSYGPPKHKWGMAIDTGACIGCHACAIACQAENNIPVVGKDQVSRGRIMHWLRVDHYTDGPEDDPTGFHFQPVPCMHCEHAPCEYVCPVEATVHSDEGLNEMVYNRCVGTRFCSNNCPYKVRRFNFLLFADYESTLRGLQYNPEVTVRSRGVMEKCSYCVQRIRQAEIDTETEQRPLRDGEVLTACQAACPVGAIVFGDVNDAKSDVAQCKQSPLEYGLLAYLNTTPRTTYLAELRNPNPDIEQ